MARLVRSAKATRDQDHCRTPISSHPRIPDRSAAMQGRGPSPLAGTIDGLALLGRCGADVIAIPCHTAHVWLPDLMRATGVPILSLVDAVEDEFARRGLTGARVGLLATLRMMRSDTYRHGLSPCHDVVSPDEARCTAVEAAIRSVKAGEIADAREPLTRVVRDVAHHDVAAVILGCTELPIALPEPTAPCGMPLVDSTRCLAEACLAWVSATEAARATA